MNNKQIEAIRQRAEKATAAGPGSSEDTRFMISARRDIPTLLAEVERLRNVLLHIDDLSDEFFTVDSIEGQPTFVLRPELEKFSDIIHEISIVSYEAVKEENDD